MEDPSEDDEGHGVTVCPERHDEMVIDVPVKNAVILFHQR